MELSFEIDKITESIELAKYYALDDVGFLGVPDKRHTEKYFAEIGKIIANMRRKRTSKLA